MSNEKENIAVSQLEELHTSGAGYDVLRYLALPELLGKESDTLLYFMGRSIARKLDIHTMEDIFFCFDKLGWGRLELVKQKKKQLIFNLMSDGVAYRLKSKLNTDFRLEAGFLAEAVQKINDVECECIEEINKRIYQIQFSVMYSK